MGRSTIARILKAAGLPPQPERPTSCQTFVRAHWGVIAGTDFFTTEVWTWRGLVTSYSEFVIDLASRRVQIVGSTPYPNDLFMCQVGRTLTGTDGLLRDHRVLICDRDRKWRGEVWRLLNEAGLRVVQTRSGRRMRMCTRNASCDRLKRSASIGSFRSASATFEGTLKEFVAHCHCERNHQGLENRLNQWRRAEATRRPNSSASAARWLAELLRASGVTIGASAAHPLGPRLGHYGRAIDGLANGLSREELALLVLSGTDELVAEVRPVRRGSYNCGSGRTRRTQMRTCHCGSSAEAPTS